MRLVTVVSALALALTASSALAQAPAPQTATAAKASAAPYSVAKTDIGTLLDDPAVKAVLAKRVPELVQNDEIDMARGMTLADVQQYAPDMLTEKALADIDADLAKLPGK
ncbi:hypothetical protein LJR219_004386 [Phenylobacterium sp. LjRoot219]|uniref:hypothetical protein n=1 Tax=Phenylobacterium sp. LjRoot219 TaxID=3342283 RepID=UPI003ECCE3D3